MPQVVGGGKVQHWFYSSMCPNIPTRAYKTRYNNEMHLTSRNDMYRGSRSYAGTVWTIRRDGTPLEWDGMGGWEWGLG